MKLAITANTPKTDSDFEPRFGRCNYFLIYDTDASAWVPLPNPAAQTSGGAGPLAAQFLADQGIDAVVSGDFGPKAAMALDAAGIEMFSAHEGRVEMLLEEFLDGALKQVTGGTGEERHGRLGI